MKSVAPYLTVSGFLQVDVLQLSGNSFSAGYDASTDCIHLYSDYSGSQVDYASLAESAYYAASAGACAWSGISSKPTTLSGYGITDAASSSHTHAFSALTSKPTTLSGYGITDALALAGGTLTGGLTLSEASNSLVLNMANPGRMSLAHATSQKGVLSWSNSALNLGFNMWEDGATWQGGASTTGGVFRVLSDGQFTWLAKTTGFGSGTEIMRLSAGGALTVGGLYLSGYSIWAWYDDSIDYVRIGADYSGSAVNYSDNSGYSNASNYAYSAPWSGISGHPTTLSGYGITDAKTLTAFGTKSGSTGTLVGSGATVYYRNLTVDGVTVQVLCFT